MPTKKVTPEVLEEMEKLMGEGLTYEEIARKLGLSLSTVAVYMRGEGKRTRITPEIIEKMVELGKRGFTYKKIAGELGISLQTVARRMRDEGLGAGEKR